jgi:hypothetical protein
MLCSSKLQADSTKRVDKVAAEKRARFELRMKILWLEYLRRRYQAISAVMR